MKICQTEAIELKKLADTLLIIDLQNGVCYAEQEIANLPFLVSRINERIHDYHHKGRPIIFIQHNDQELVTDTFAWQIIDCLATDKATHFVQKTHANAFYQTDLADLLNNAQVTSIEICGAQTEYCVDATVKFAHGLGYQIQMEKQLTTTYAHPPFSAMELINFYEAIWEDRFVTFI